MGAAQLRPIEVASGLVFGVEAARETTDHDARITPLAALEGAILPALQRPPCLVSFSGGRDSSAVLAVAVRLARREGLPLPIPATNRFPAAVQTDETEWQELVVDRLGLADWHRLVLEDELDAVGPLATEALRRHGLLWPCNAHFHVPLLEAARGGSLLTGIGGDEQLGESSYARANDVLARRARPERRDLLRVGFAFAPAALRAVALRRSPPQVLPWLRPRAQRQVAAAWARQTAQEPRPYDRRVRWWPRLRSVRIGFKSLELLARDADAVIVHPLADASFAAALAAFGHDPGGGRTARMHALFGDMLPPEVLSRPTKTLFDEALWGRHAREFAARWSGTGAPPDLVDLEQLCLEWRAATPIPQSLTLLQAGWLAYHEQREPAASGDRAKAEATDRGTPSRAGGGEPRPAPPRA